MREMGRLLFSLTFPVMKKWKWKMNFCRRYHQLIDTFIHVDYPGYLIWYHIFLNFTRIQCPTFSCPNYDRWKNVDMLQCLQARCIRVKFIFFPEFALQVFWYAVIQLLSQYITMLCSSYKFMCYTIDISPDNMSISYIL